MEDADGPLSSIVSVDGLDNALLIADEVWQVMALETTERIPTVICEVMDLEVEVLQEERLERTIEVDRPLPWLGSSQRPRGHP